ncbi:peptidoglycan-binding domain-containing protein [Pseudovibrio sp. WM33]|uniref:peptidoglycan-binding domain-containing protein n=1 Tax=Pseudovibrio sp. WM33 TaxID=1735585 RepID=UPI0007AE6C03|nr:peptidoglycan-binding domain-containing protein [Pseudovibrio sp. WM33]KZL26561.1 putative peptidoglycan binding domain protein [Pseudovibrio sp. WM33]
MGTFFKALALAATTAVAIPSSTQADTGDVIIGLGVRAIGNTIIDHTAAQQPTPHVVTAQSQQARSIPRIPTQQTVALSRIQLKDVQYRLNLLGYNAGFPDGVAGKRTLRAIGRFQSTLGYVATGRLTQSQLEELYTRTQKKRYQKTQIDQAQPTPTQPPLPQSNPGGYSEAEKATVRIPKENKLALDPKNPPNIYGLITGMRSDETAFFLKTEGYEECVETTGLTICKKATKNLEETVSVNKVGNVIYGVSRTVTFKTAAPRSAVLTKLAEAYPNLTRFKRMATSSSKTCLEQYAGDGSSLLAPTEANPSDPETLLTLTENCRNFYAIELEGNRNLKSMRITLYDGHPIQQAEEEQTGIFQTKSEAADELKF